jgi:hypothetical protein
MPRKNDPKGLLGLRRSGAYSWEATFRSLYRISVPEASGRLLVVLDGQSR